MISIRKSLFLIVVALASLSVQCSLVEPLVAEEKPVPSKTVTISFTAEASKCLVNKVGNMLEFRWQNNSTRKDKLYCYSNQGYLGSLDIISGDGQTSGQFSGSLAIKEGVDSLRFYHFGTEVTPETSTTTKISLAQQDGTTEYLEKWLVARYACKYEESVQSYSGNMTVLFAIMLADLSGVNTSTSAATLTGLSKASIQIDANGVYCFSDEDEITLKDVGTTSSNYFIFFGPQKMPAGARIIISGDNTYYKNAGNLTLRPGTFYTGGSTGDAIPFNKAPYQWIDLGMDVLWANMNLGSTDETDYGSYFAWGEVEARSNDYSWSNYKYYGGDSQPLTKYNDNYNPNTTYWILQKADDAVSSAYGEGRTPTIHEWDLLLKNCDFTWTVKDGKNGYLVTKKGTSSPSIFLPASGYKNGGSAVSDAGSLGRYLSSDRTRHTSSDVNNKTMCKGLNISNTQVSITDLIERCYGCSVRGVKDKNRNAGFVDLGLASGTLWAEENIEAQSENILGLYLAWGELHPKTDYTTEGYLYTDNPGTLPQNYDAAYLFYGDHKNAHIPTLEQCNELIANCYMVWTENYNGGIYSGVKGIIVYKALSDEDKGKYATSPATGYDSSVAHIFLPATGFMEGSSKESDACLHYWTSTISTSNGCAYSVYGDFEDFHTDYTSERAIGRALRAVKAKE